MIVFTARKGFIDKNRAAMVDFMEDTLRVVRWYLDDHASGWRSPRGPQDSAERSPACSTDQDYAPQWQPDAGLKALRRMSIRRSTGLHQSKLDVQKYTDLSIIQEAAAG